MHIVMLFSAKIPVRDGIAFHVVDLAKRLKARGYIITLVTRGSWRKRKEFEYNGFKVIEVPFYPLYPFHVYFHGFFVQKAIEALVPQPDLVHLHSPLVPSLLKKWPIVTTFHSSACTSTRHIEDIGLRTFLIKLMGRTTSRWIEKKLLNISDAVITVSQDVADDIRIHDKFHGGQLCPMTNVVDIDFYKPVHHFSGEKKLIYVGRIAYGKGLFDIINSSKYVIERYPDIKYIFIGSGPLEAELRSMIKKDNLGQHFEFYGEICDPSIVLQHYQNAYAVLMPSYYEGSPIALLEAMACGKPIISTNAVFSKKMLKNGVNALLVAPKSAKELAKASVDLLSSEELCKRLGKAARKTVEMKINSQANTDKIEEIYKQAVQCWKLAKKVKKKR